MGVWWHALAFVTHERAKMSHKPGRNVTQAGPKCHTRAKMSHCHVIILHNDQWHNNDQCWFLINQALRNELQWFCFLVNRQTFSFKKMHLNSILCKTSAVLSKGAMRKIDKVKIISSHKMLEVSFQNISLKILSVKCGSFYSMLKCGLVKCSSEGLAALFFLENQII